MLQRDPGAVRARRRSKRTATDVTRSGWNFQSAPICQVTTNRPGGSHAVTTPVSVSVPSSWRVNQRPPTRGSMTISWIGAEPMWCAGGHHDVMSAVKISNAAAGATSTTTSRRTASTIVSMLFNSSVRWANAASERSQNASRWARSSASPSGSTW